MLRLPAIATAVVLAILGLYWALAWFAADRKLAAVEPLSEGRASYRVTLDFPPERFHQLYLQDKGRLVGVHGNVVDMMDVDAHALRAIAGHYWVASVERWKP